MNAKYNNIGINYNKTRFADPYITERLLKNLKPKIDGLYLDIGCGTGNYTNELQKKGFQFIGIDPSEVMLEKAKQKNHNIDWKLGKAENIPLASESIDGVVGSLTMHHWDNLEKGFTEIYRVLKPNSNSVVFTSTPKQMKGYWLNHYFPKMLADSMLQMPAFKTVKTAMTNSGLSKIETELYSIKPNIKDLFLYSGKQNPKLYLDAAVRHGISSFSALANTNEVKKGLIKLENDIANHTIESIIESYSNDLGDYIFISVKKIIG